MEKKGWLNSIQILVQDSYFEDNSGSQPNFVAFVFSINVEIEFRFSWLQL